MSRKKNPYPIEPFRVAHVTTAGGRVRLAYRCKGFLGWWMPGMEPDHPFFDYEVTDRIVADTLADAGTRIPDNKFFPWEHELYARDCLRDNVNN